jgi:hypothetical protein
MDRTVGYKLGTQRLRGLRRRPADLVVTTGNFSAFDTDWEDLMAALFYRDLVVGSDLSFDDRGTHQLKGIGGERHVLAVATTSKTRRDAEYVVKHIAARSSTDRARNLAGSMA